MKKRGVSWITEEFGKLIVIIVVIIIIGTFAFLARDTIVQSVTDFFRGGLL